MNSPLKLLDLMHSGTVLQKNLRLLLEKSLNRVYICKLTNDYLNIFIKPLRSKQ